MKGNTVFSENIPQGQYTVYKENNMGPNMDPWGIPQRRGAADEEN